MHGCSRQYEIYVYLGSFEAHACPLGGSKVHSFRNTVATAHF